MCVLCRFTLDELEDFLEAAKEAIPGVREAIVAAHSHKAHQVWQHFLWHLDMHSNSILRRLHAGGICYVIIWLGEAHTPLSWWIVKAPAPALLKDWRLSVNA